MMKRPSVTWSNCAPSAATIAGWWSGGLVMPVEGQPAARRQRGHEHYGRGDRLRGGEVTADPELVEAGPVGQQGLPRVLGQRLVHCPPGRVQRHHERAEADPPSPASSPRPRWRVVENLLEDGEWAILEWYDPLSLRAAASSASGRVGSPCSAGTGTGCPSTRCTGRPAEGNHLREAGRPSSGGVMPAGRGRTVGKAAPIGLGLRPSAVVRPLVTCPRGRDRGKLPPQRAGPRLR
jgi:hypothetical protein